MNKAGIVAAALLMGINAKAQVFDMDTILYNGNKEKIINLVILGDGYTTSELPKLVTDATNFTTTFFNEIPYSNYRNFFNVIIIKVPSNQSGASHPGTAPDEPPIKQPVITVDNYFGSAFDSYNIHRLLVATNSAAISNVLATNFPDYDQALILVNSPYYGGSGGYYPVASTNDISAMVAIHEIGHSFSALADEYWPGPQYAMEAINMTRQTNLELLKWKNWYGYFDIGLYPHEESPAWYRPHQNCAMRYLGAPFCSVCTEGIIEKIHASVSPLISYKPDYTDISEEVFPLTFKLDLIKPVPNSLRRTWNINGNPFKKNVDSVLLHKTDFIKVSNRLTVTIEDTTQLLRKDNHSIIHASLITWNMKNTITGIENITSSSNDIIINVFPNPLTDYLNINYQGEINGTLKVEIIDLQGKIQASFLLNSTILNSLNLENLTRGIYIARFYINDDFISSKKIFKIE